jgi:hypothetical protein
MVYNALFRHLEQIQNKLNGDLEQIMQLLRVSSQSAQGVSGKDVRSAVLFLCFSKNWGIFSN